YDFDRTDGKPIHHSFWRNLNRLFDKLGDGKRIQLSVIECKMLRTVMAIKALAERFKARDVAIYKIERVETMILEADERIKSGTMSYALVSHRSKYDPIIDQFLESEHDLVRDVEGKKPQNMASLINRRIRDRGLGDKIKASMVNSRLYLEKV
ncbi:unnamed protein product, partial [marine sediment metagenome]